MIDGFESIVIRRGGDKISEEQVDWQVETNGKKVHPVTYSAHLHYWKIGAWGFDRKKAAEFTTKVRQLSEPHYERR